MASDRRRGLPLSREPFLDPARADPGLDTLSALSLCTRSLGLGQSLDDLLDEVMVEARRLVGFERCALLLLDSEREELIVERVLGYGQEAAEVQAKRIRIGEGLASLSVLKQKPIRVGDVLRDPRYVEILPGVRSNMVVPLAVGDEVAGVISVESSRVDAFTEVHERALMILSTQAALAIVAHRARKQLHEEIEHLSSLYKISQLASVSAREGFEEVLATLLDVAHEVIPEGHAAILLLEPDSGCLRVRASEGYQEGVERMAIPLGRGVTGRAAKLGEVQVVNDLAEEVDYLPGVPGARSEIALPLVAEGQVIGVLNCESKRPNAYEAEKVRALKVVAQHLAVVLRTAQLHDEARRLSITDPLTGLFNRRFFLSQLDDSIRRAERYEYRLALVFVDLDRFKSINDRHGHHTGDRALQAVADAMRETLRDTDVIARIGGEEFAAVLMETGADRALQVAERFQKRVQELGFRSDQDELVTISLSGGIALFPEHGNNGADLLQHADEALYEAKRLGRNRIHVAQVSQEESGQGVS